MTPSELLKSELEEFEALLDDGENLEGHIEDRSHLLQENFNQNQEKEASSLAHLSRGSKNQVNAKSSRILASSNKNLGEDLIKTDALCSRLFEIQRPTYSRGVASLTNLKFERSNKKSYTEIRKANILAKRLSGGGAPEIILTQPKEEDEVKIIVGNIHLSPENLKESNRNLQKASYNELMTLYKNSTSQNPTRVFDDNISQNNKSRQMVSRKTSIDFKESVNTASKPVAALATSKSEIKSIKNIKDPVQNPKEEEAIRNAQKTIQEIIEAIQTNPGEHYPHCVKYESQKMETNNWKDITTTLNLSKFEILVIDIINFGIQERAEIVVKNEFSQDIGSAVNQMIKDTIGPKNEGKHVLIYLHNRHGQRKLFFSKFFFIIKNNEPYDIGLKNEKEVIMNYLIILGLFQFKLKHEDKPISEEKVNAVKSKALSLVKGTDNSASPYLCEWLSIQVRQKIYVEKYYINQNIRGKVDANFMYNLSEYLASTSSRFLLSSTKLSIREKSHPSMTSSMVNPMSRSDGYNPFIRHNRSMKGIKTPPVLDPITFEGEYIFLSTESIKNRKQVSTPAKLPGNSKELPRQMTAHTPRTQSFIPHLNIAMPPATARNMSSLNYLSAREKINTLVTPKESKGFKFVPISTQPEFFDLRIAKPDVPFQKLNAYFKISTQKAPVNLRKNS